jgi:hypothetical protein
MVSSLVPKEFGTEHHKAAKPQPQARRFTEGSRARNAFAFTCSLA